MCEYIEPMLTMAPRETPRAGLFSSMAMGSWDAIAFEVALKTRKVPNRLMSMTLLNWSMLVSSISSLPLPRTYSCESLSVMVFWDVAHDSTYTGSIYAVVNALKGFNRPVYRALDRVRGGDVDLNSFRAEARIRSNALTLQGSSCSGLEVDICYYQPSHTGSCKGHADSFRDSTTCIVLAPVSNSKEITVRLGIKGSLTSTRNKSTTRELFHTRSN